MARRALVVIGGLDSIVGSIVGALAIGLLESLTAGYVDPLVGAGFSSNARRVQEAGRFGDLDPAGADHGVPGACTRIKAASGANGRVD